MQRPSGLQYCFFNIHFPRDELFSFIVIPVESTLMSALQTLPSLWGSYLHTQAYEHQITLLLFIRGHFHFHSSNLFTCSPPRLSLGPGVVREPQTSSLGSERTPDLFIGFWGSEGTPNLLIG